MFKQIFESLFGPKAVKMRMDSPAHTAGETGANPDYSLVKGHFPCNPENVRNSVGIAFPDFKNLTVKVDYEA